MHNISYRFLPYTKLDLLLCDYGFVIGAHACLPVCSVTSPADGVERSPGGGVGKLLAALPGSPVYTVTAGGDPPPCEALC